MKTENMKTENTKTENMKTENMKTKNKTLADFAPALLQALRNIAHPMASEDDLQDAVELLDAIDAARMGLAADFKGLEVWHGSPSYESPEIISGVIDHGDFIEVEFESGVFTNIPVGDFIEFIRRGRASYRRAGSGSLAGAFESIVNRL